MKIKRTPLCLKPVPENFCVVMPKDLADKLSRAIGQRVPSGNPSLPCALEEGHEGDCVPMCNKPVQGRHARREGGPQVEELCYLPLGHDKRCRNIRGGRAVFTYCIIHTKRRRKRRRPTEAKNINEN